MITVVLQGGLGNQMFQYAYGRALEKLGKEVIYDTGFFQIETKYTKRSLGLLNFTLYPEIKLLPVCARQNVIRRLFNRFDPDVKVRYVPINPKKDNYIADGYYNSEKYFSHLREDLIRELKIKEKRPEYIEWENKIKNANKPLIIHARRGDYLNAPGFAVQTEDYYKSALSHFDEDCEIFGFSDDSEWLKNALGKEITIVSGQGLKDYEELSLMTKGQNFIIANSTFSWWGAWLSVHPEKKVIAPKNWFTQESFKKANEDVVPAEWLRV